MNLTTEKHIVLCKYVILVQLMDPSETCIEFARLII